MASRIEDYAFLSDLQSAALVGSDGSIDWLTFPRFDSPACFAALLGEPKHGRWLLAPAGGGSVRRHYRDGSLVLETVFECAEGEVAVIDCMPMRDEHLNVVRVVEGRRGRVPMVCDLTIRFGYGASVPWVRHDGNDVVAVAGPDALRLVTPVDLHGEGADDSRHTVGHFEVAAGDRVPFVMTWHPSHADSGEPIDAVVAIADTESWWRDWSSGCTYDGHWTEEVQRSLTVLKGLTYAPTGGLCAAPTTSLPESIGAGRNWDYRYCWLRDATFTLTALMDAGHMGEAEAWRDWLLRAVAGDPKDLQIMYGLAGERDLPERILDWLPGYEGSTPVRMGNAAADQFQLDVYGEVIDALHEGTLKGLPYDDDAWHVQRALLDFLEGNWREPDEGIWEVRGPRRQFTHSKLMAWVAADRIVRSAEASSLSGPLDRWRALRDDISSEILAEGVDDRGVFVQAYGSHEVDASLLLVPIVGFLPPDDERVTRTVSAIEDELMDDGFLRRYRAESGFDGLPGGEGAFLLCTFWLADVKALRGERTEAIAIFERLLGLRNDVGLLSEEYDPRTGRLLGNVPQAFSHTAIVNTALTLHDRSGPAQRRSART